MGEIDHSSILENMMDCIKVDMNQLEINVFFVDSSFTRNDIYKLFKLSSTRENLIDTVEKSMRYIDKIRQERSFEKYDLEVSVDETVQIVKKKSVINGSILIDKISGSSFENDNILDEKVNLSKIKTIVIQLYSPKFKKSIYLFEKYVHPTSKFRNACKFTLVGRDIKPFNKEIITLHSVIDAILYEDTYYVFNRSNFNSIFNYKDLFYRVIEDNRKMIKQSGFISNTDEFIDECRNDGRYLPRLTKVILAKGFENIVVHKSKLPQLKQEFGLNIVLRNDGTIEYNNKQQVNDILNVLLEHCVVSALTERKMLAKAIEAYKE